MTDAFATRPRPAPPSLAVLEVGFRPFFLAGAAWAVAALAIWLAALDGRLSPGGTVYGPLLWHAHEMVFGVGAAVVGGFLLTAVPSWTGQPKLVGGGLALLVVAWALGRAVMLVPDSVGLPAVIAVDLAFLAILAVRTGWQVRASRNWRNLPVVAGPMLLLTGNLLFHAEAAGLLTAGGDFGAELGLAAIVLLVAVIGGRIIPAFTRNWLMNTGRGGPLPVEPARFDVAVLLATSVAFAAWLGWSTSFETGVLAAVVAAGHAVRLLRWRGWRTGAEPLVWVLHLGYLWVPVGFALMAGAALAPEAVPEAAVLHAFAAGAMGTMMLAMMTRATLGHTGRALTADRATAAVYLLITVTAALRVTAALVPDLYGTAIALSGAGWIMAFGVYLLAYAPKLCRRRVAAGG
ncbi:short-chain dehydrogenase [Thalassobaculum fulvum]|uniref:Short-chain dehydrogenase n=1 Tax=Thalassobaculum fulvum TaxID=1633335 RepID=A0A918XT33_9PROT|nr:NnrS family protein [Thalassobaculum fulvum]GHD51872.1 short-chain dehydrogenase [Thalassobaculum fulvum]